MAKAEDVYPSRYTDVLSVGTEPTGNWQLFPYSMSVVKFCPRSHNILTDALSPELLRIYMQYIYIYIFLSMPRSFQVEEVNLEILILHVGGSCTTPSHGSNSPLSVNK